MAADGKLRELLARHLDWEEAHTGYERAVAGFAAELRGVVPDGFARSGWQMVEHLRLAQADILDFCVNPDYRWPDWPAAYWPQEPAPPDEAAWDASVAAFEADVRALKALALDGSRDLFATVPAGREGQTCARELLLVQDHNAYHLGQLVALRRALGAWSDRRG